MSLRSGAWRLSAAIPIRRKIDARAPRVYRAVHDDHNDDRARKSASPPRQRPGARVIVCVPPGRGPAALPGLSAEFLSGQCVCRVGAALVAALSEWAPTSGRLRASFDELWGASTPRV